nr:PhoX family phosphatase [Acinetobacter sp. Marseille-Q1620]
MTDLTPYNEEQELDNNFSDNTHFRDILERHISRRSLISKTASGAAALAFASSLSGCNDDKDMSFTPPTPPSPPNPPVVPPTLPKKLQFTPVAKNLNDIVTVPEGYEANVLYSLGDSINPKYSDWDGIAEVPAAASYQFRSGDCHDGMSYFGMHPTKATYDPTQSDQGLLVLNHEYIIPLFLHDQGATSTDGRRPEDEVLREVNAHGVSIIEINKDSKTQAVSINKSSVFNRRITASTPMDFAGPVKNSDLLKTKFSPDGSKTRGTHNNCGNGYTPWGTYLTTEENFIGYFARAKEDDANRAVHEIVALNRYGLKTGRDSRYGWDTVIAKNTDQDLYNRWTADASGNNATEDYRNGPNTFGWIVEIDPFNGGQHPVKRTALGRFAHEDCRASRLIEGENLAFYMGDDSTGEYIYKFVSDAKWDAKDINRGYDAGDKYMNNGKLYVAKFNEDGTGQWIELAIGKNGLDASNKTYPFKEQAEVLTYARLAGDAVGATKMDRPEWVAVNPNNGEVYVTLTNNSARGSSYNTDAANPRNYKDSKNNKGNVNGHIIRFRETGDKTTAETFTWDIYLFGAEAAMASNINLSGLTDNNDFSSPDGMWFDPRGVLWIQTDDFSYRDKTNCMMLAALPGKQGDGAKTTAVGNQTTFAGAKVTDDNLRRFLTGPKECEITGVTMTPDYKAIFINVQHPGENSKPDEKPHSHWPATQKDPNNKTARPRSATIVITRKDGGVIAG